MKRIRGLRQYGIDSQAEVNPLGLLHHGDFLIASRNAWYERPLRMGLLFSSHICLTGLENER